MHPSAQPVSLQVERPNQGRSGVQEIEHKKQSKAAEACLPFFHNDFNWNREHEWKGNIAGDKISPTGTQSTVSAMEISDLSCPSLCSKTTLGTRSDSQYEHASHESLDEGMSASMFSGAQIAMPLADISPAATVRSVAGKEQPGEQTESLVLLNARVEIGKPYEDNCVTLLEQSPARDETMPSQCQFPAGFESGGKGNDQGIPKEIHLAQSVGRGERCGPRPYGIDGKEGNWNIESDEENYEADADADGLSSSCSTPGKYSFSYLNESCSQAPRRHSFESQHVYAQCWDLGSLRQALEPAPIVQLSPECSGAGYVAATGDEAGEPSSLPVSNSLTNSGDVGSQQPGALRKRGPVEDDGGEGSGGNNGGQKRPRKTGDDDTSTPGLRYSCPYPKRYTWHHWNCSLQRTRSQPGGYEDFTQVRIHVMKYHCLSQRCKRCWMRMTKSKLATHEALGLCTEKDCPYPGLLTEEKEADIRSVTFRGTNSEKWHNFFLALFSDASTVLEVPTPYYECTIPSTQVIPPRMDSDPSRLTPMTPALPPVMTSRSDGATTHDRPIITFTEDLIELSEVDFRPNQFSFWATEPGSTSQDPAYILTSIENGPELIEGQLTTYMAMNPTSAPSYPASMQQPDTSHPSASIALTGQANQKAMELLQDIDRRHKYNVEYLGHIVQPTQGLPEEVHVPLRIVDLLLLHKNMEKVGNALDFLISSLLVQGTIPMDIRFGEGVPGN
ncbi:hypothetical protein PT974_07596 [Cladobotryum mycophilum]|uniref:Uncharacterized protein n=1 Tax=Cladobotryum mycophilum TaxID=491253 RepID=A0ABR0SR04_9HYPO